MVKEIYLLERSAQQSVYMNLWPPAWTLYLAGRKKIHVSLFLVEQGNWRRTVVHAHMQRALYGIRESGRPMKVDEMVRTLSHLPLAHPTCFAVSEYIGFIGLCSTAHLYDAKAKSASVDTSSIGSKMSVLSK